MGKAQRGEATVNLFGQGKSREGGLGGLGKPWPVALRLVSLDPEQQAVQGVLCEGDSRQSRLLGLVRCRLEHGGREYA